MSIFHIAIPTHDIAAAKEFYDRSLGADVGREYPGYVIFNFFGHQLVCHLHDKIDEEVQMYPRHFGIIMEDKPTFDAVYQKAKAAGVKFYEELFERFANKPAWHWSFFLIDPSNNLIEFKFYKNQDLVFAKGSF